MLIRLHELNGIETQAESGDLGHHTPVICLTFSHRALRSSTLLLPHDPDSGMSMSFVVLMSYFACFCILVSSFVLEAWTVLGISTCHQYSLILKPI